MFTDNGKAVGLPARTLKEFVSPLKTLPLSVLEGHARRGDFSQWIGDVFHDHVLASDVRKVEQRYRLGHTRDLYNALAESIQARYELFPEMDDVQSEIRHRCYSPRSICLPRMNIAWRRRRQRIYRIMCLIQMSSPFVASLRPFFLGRIGNCLNPGALDDW